jgi:hypothetical protein
MVASQIPVVQEAEFGVLMERQALVAFSSTCGVSVTPTPVSQTITEGLGNATDSGWGQTYESYVSGGVAQHFILTYLYDDAGEPRWTLGSLAASQASGPVSTYQVQCPLSGTWNRNAVTIIPVNTPN